MLMFFQINRIFFMTTFFFHKFQLKKKYFSIAWDTFYLKYERFGYGWESHFQRNFRTYF